MTGLKRVRVERFKNIKDTDFDLEKINLVIGANNSGKSSLLQAIHFAIGCLQSLELIGKLRGTRNISSTASSSQLIYVPSDDAISLGAGGTLVTDAKQSIRITLQLETGEEVRVAVRKGKNRNINIAVSNLKAARKIASLAKPFTIFTPGLAGITKKEQHVSDGVLLRAIARGDANLVLRNTLLRLWESENRDLWNAFLADLHTIFPSLDLDVSFEAKTDEYITVTVTEHNSSVPLELCGTGVLQAIQILSYVHYYQPEIIVLDEPDSHLHPNNQRLLCELLFEVAETRGIQVILSTHSRHVFDALRSRSSVLWMRDGIIDTSTDDDDLAILLELGALDIKERLKVEEGACIVLTEDERINSLGVVLAASGFDMRLTQVLPYFGTGNLQHLRTLMRFVRDNGGQQVVVHRDRDYMTDEEADEWSVQVRNLKAFPFVTEGVDIESHYLSGVYISELNGIPLEQAEEMIQKARSKVRDDSVKKYVNSRVRIEKNIGDGRVNAGEIAIKAEKDVDSNLPRYALGKAALAKLREIFRDAYGRNIQVGSLNAVLSDPSLERIADQIFKNSNKKA